MFSRHVIRAKAANEAEQKTSGNGVKRGDAKDQEERELLLKLLAMQDQAELYKGTFKSTKQSLQSLQENQIHNALVQQSIGEGGAVQRKELEVLQQMKRELQSKVEILSTSNGNLTAEEKESLAEVLAALKSHDAVPDPSESSATGGRGEGRGGKGGRGGGKGKRSRGDAFESTMSVLGTAALQFAQGLARQEETQWEATARRFMEYKMQERPVAPQAQQADPSEDAVHRRLKNMKDWKDQGLINDEQYNDAVSKILTVVNK
jgi:hypothetical protein